MLKISKRAFLKSAAAAALAPVALAASRSSYSAEAGPTNVVLICCDDLGYGDLSCYRSIVSSTPAERTSTRGTRRFYGSGIHTPNLDRLALEGMLFCHFNSASPVCSPSRASLLTGLYPARAGVVNVLFPTDQTGLPQSVTTIAGMLKPLGYKSSCIGKWHLGSEKQFLPTNHGFDEFYGLPYSHDMDPLPLMQDTEVIEEPVNLQTLMQRYTDRAVSFLANTKGSPFFLYFAPFQPHLPLIVSERFKGKSGMGAYGDNIMEVDWSVGRILNALVENGMDSNTLVIFTSDQGPWYQGSSANLRGRKGETYEGGVRVPFIARLPGRIPMGSICNELASNMDILPTLAEACGAPLPAGPLDGINIWPLLTGQVSKVTRDALLYFDKWSVQCARLSNWKLHVARYNCLPWGPAPADGRCNLPLPNPELYRLDWDPEECFDVADTYPEVVSAIMARIEALIPTFPAQATSDWDSTRSMKVLGTAAGALPIPA